MAKINDVEFIDNSDELKKLIEEKAIDWLYEASGEVQAQAARNSRVDSGQLKGSWKNVVDESKQVAFIGSRLENAIWEEYGTGEYAVGNKGRKTPWRYKDRKGNWHYTNGKKPNHTLEKAFNMKNKKIKDRLAQLLKEVEK